MSKDQEIHNCKQENLIRDMHGDIKIVIDQNKTLNKSFEMYAKKLEEHISDSYIYRKKIDAMWTGVHVLKWVTGFLLGAGLIWKAIEVYLK